MEENTKQKQGLKKEVFDFVKILVLCFVVALGIKTFIAQPVFVEGSSMYPTLEDGEFGFTNLLGISLGEINRGDIVIVSHDNEYWVKRVIGLPNETIECQNGVVLIDGEPLEEPYLETSYVQDIEEQQHYFTSDFEAVTLGENEYFVMGDNRVVSADSRIVGAFDRDQIIGKGVFVIYPFDQIGYHNQ